MATAAEGAGSQPGHAALPRPAAAPDGAAHEPRGDLSKHGGRLDFILFVLHYNGAQTIGLKNKVWRGLGAQVPWVPREMPGQPGPSSGSRCLWATRGETVWGRETESSNNAGNTSQKCLWCYHLMFSAS